MKYFNLRAMPFVLGLAMALSVMSCDDEDEVKDEKGGTNDGLEWVDLGLPSGTLWAPYNVGAERPEEFGDYVSWGKIQFEGSEDDLNVDVSELKNLGVIDKNGNLTAEYDVATKKYGGHMPTLSQWQELYDKCTWVLLTLNGVDGYKVKGINGESIFLPAAGCRSGDNQFNVGSHGYYWSSTPDPDYADYAYRLRFVSDIIDPNNYDFRFNGLSVRPVSEKGR